MCALCLQRSSFVAIVCLALGLSAVAAEDTSARPLAVPNASFESPEVPLRQDISVGPDDFVTRVADWKFDGSGAHGVAIWAAGYADLLDKLGAQGGQYGFIVGSGTLTRTVDTPVRSGKRYTLTVALGNRRDLDPGQYVIRLLVDGKEVAASKPIKGTSIAEGKFHDFSITYDGNAAHGRTLSVQLEHGKLAEGPDGKGFQGSFDNVRLSTTETEASDGKP